MVVVLMVVVMMVVRGQEIVRRIMQHIPAPEKPEPGDNGDKKHD
jgi:hypothetical protein